MQTIAGAIKDSTICSLSRANDRDISRAAEALKGANSARIHTFIATSPLHMEKKLRMTPEQVLEQAKQSVRFARNLVADVEFSPEDGYRSDMDFLCRVLEVVIQEGATTINVPDTVGYAVPELYGNFIRTLRERIPNSDKAVWSVHCHNDLGMAVANSLAGVKIGGARQVECTINGLGKRVCTRVWHTSGRGSQGAGYLRDHASRRCGMEREQDRAGQIERSQCVQAALAGSGC